MKGIAHLLQAVDHKIQGLNVPEQKVHPRRSSFLRGDDIIRIVQQMTSMKLRILVPASLLRKMPQKQLQCVRIGVPVAKYCTATVSCVNLAKFMSPNSAKVKPDKTRLYIIDHHCTSGFVPQVDKSYRQVQGALATWITAFCGRLWK